MPTTETSPAGVRPRRRLTGVLRSVGPGVIVTAAFIGPGTVTTATLAGATYGYSLLWALTFSIVATLVLQEMAARLGLVSGAGLGEAVRRQFERGPGRFLAAGLVIAAIAFGNAAYQTGNLLGAALGGDAIIGGGTRLWAVGFGVVAFILLFTGSYRVLERALVGLVVLMSAVFVTTAAALLPPLPELLGGLFIPRLPAEGTRGLLVALGLIGTTVVPYNLFLHAVTVREKWSGPESLGTARLELVLAVVLGGLVSMSIVVTSSAMRGAEIASAADMAIQLEPLLGRWARVFFAAGLLGAGLTSSITAPLAAAYATAGVLGWKRDLRDPRLRAVWMAVLGTGLAFAAAGVRPVPAILFAQVANGMLLPAIAAFLLLAANDRRTMGPLANGPFRNALGALVVLITLVLGGWAVLRALG